MLISLLSYLLISNALTLRKDKSILFSRIVVVISNIFNSKAFFIRKDKYSLFSRIVIVPLILTTCFLGYLAISIHSIYHFYTNPVYYTYIILFLIFMLSLVCLIISFFKLELITLFSLFSVNLYLTLQVFNLCFAFCCFLINNFEFLEWYFVLSNNYNPMDLNNMLNSDPISSHEGGSGGGPSNSAIPVAPQQDHSGQTQDYQPSITHEAILSQYDYSEIGNRLHSKVERVLADRKSNLDQFPYYPSGRPAKLSEAVYINQIDLSKKDMAALKELVNSPDFPTKYSGFKNTISGRYPKNSIIHPAGIKFELINYIKGINNK